MADLERLVNRAEALMQRLEELLPPSGRAPDWSAHVAFRWRKRFNRGYLQPITHPHKLSLADLQRIDRQKDELYRNTRQFMAGLPANNVLLWGARGTGKSSLIKAVLNAFSDKGLRLVEVEKDELIELPDIVDMMYGRDERFIIYCDDLSFEAHEASYKALKAVLDGSVSATPENVIIYATSNRRHLLPEYMSENQQTQVIDGELHHGEAVEEKISLSERFGVWLSFHPFSQDDYLAVVDYWLRQLGHKRGLDKETRENALRWALTRGSRSGRVAWQFSRDWVGRYGIA